MNIGEDCSYEFKEELLAGVCGGFKRGFSRSLITFDCVSASVCAFVSASIRAFRAVSKAGTRKLATERKTANKPLNIKIETGYSGGSLGSHHGCAGEIGAVEELSEIWLVRFST